MSGTKVCHGVTRDCIPTHAAELKYLEHMQEGGLGLIGRKECQQSQGLFWMPQQWEYLLLASARLLQDLDLGL